MKCMCFISLFIFICFMVKVYIFKYFYFSFYDSSCPNSFHYYNILFSLAFFLCVQLFKYSFLCWFTFYIYNTFCVTFDCCKPSPCMKLDHMIMIHTYFWKLLQILILEAIQT